MKKENDLQDLVTDSLLAPLSPYAEGLYAVETEPFKSPDDAIEWFKAAAIVLADKPGVAEVEYVQEEDRKLIPGVSIIGGQSFGLHTIDDLGNDFRVSGYIRFDSYGGVRTTVGSSSTLRCITPLGDDKKIATFVNRYDNQPHPLEKKHAKWPAVYTVSKEDYDELNGDFEPKQTVTRYRELNKKESKEAEAKYLEVATNMRMVIESRLGPQDPEAVQSINDMAALEKRQRAAAFTSKLELY